MNIQHFFYTGVLFISFYNQNYQTQLVTTTDLSSTISSYCLSWFINFENSLRLVANTTLVGLAVPKVKQRCTKLKATQKTDPSDPKESNSQVSKGAYTVSLWLKECLFLYSQNNFASLEIQFSTFVKYAKPNSLAFEKGFEDLPDHSLSGFLKILLYCYRTAIKKATNDDLSDLDFLCSLYFLSLSKRVSQGMDLEAIRSLLNNLINMLLELSFAKLPSCSQKIKFFLQTCRENHLLLFVTILNNNCLSFNNKQTVLDPPKLKILTQLTLELFKPLNSKWFILERAYFWVFSQFFLFFQEKLPLQNKAKSIGLLLNTNCNFFIAFGFFLQSFLAKAFHDLRFWLILVFVLLQADPTLALAPGPDQLNLVSTWNVLPILSVGMFCKKAKTRKRVKASANQNNITARKNSSRLNSLLEWFYFNRIVFVDVNTDALSTEQAYLYNQARDLRAYISDDVVNKLASQGLDPDLQKTPEESPQKTPEESPQKTLPPSELKSVQGAYAKLGAVLAELKKPDSALLKALGENLASDERKTGNKKLLPQLGLDLTGPDENFLVFVESFLQTLMPNKQGRFSLIGSVYPYSFMGALRQVYAGLFDLLEKPNSPFYAFSGLLATGGGKTVPEARFLQSAHLYPERITKAFKYDHSQFLAVFLPAELNKSFEELVFGKIMWYLLYYSSMNIKKTGQESTRQIDLYTLEGLRSMVAYGFEAVWKEKIESRDSNLFANISDFSSGQRGLVKQSYLEAMLGFVAETSTKFPTNEGREYCTFTNQISTVHSLTDSLDKLISPQERLLHYNAYLTLLNYFNANNITLLATNLKSMGYIDLLPFLSEFSELNSLKPEKLKSFFDSNCPAIVSIKENLVETVKGRLGGIIFSYVAAFTQYSLYCLRSADILRILELPSPDNYTSILAFNNSVQDLIRLDETKNLYVLKQTGVDQNLKALSRYVFTQQVNFFNIIKDALDDIQSLEAMIEAELPVVAVWYKNSPNILLATELNLLERFRKAIIIYLVSELESAIKETLIPEIIQNHLLAILRLFNILNKEVTAKQKMITVEQINTLLFFIFLPFCLRQKGKKIKKVKSIFLFFST